jgi:predicted phosphodiesterase
MKICIVSDSHDRAEPLAAAVNQAKSAGAQAVIHCGDLISANTLRASIKLGVPLHVVHGNNLGDAMAMHKMMAKSGGMLTYRWQGSEEHRLHPVCRFARRESSAPLFAHLLHGVAQADALCARGLWRIRNTSKR